MRWYKKELGNFVSLEEESIKKKKREDTIKKANNKTQRNQIYKAKENVLRNAIRLYDKRNIINAFVKENIYFGNIERDV